MKKNFIIILVLLVFTIFISGCIGFLTTPGEDSIVPGKGILKIYLTDAPGVYKEVNIIISKIEGHIDGEDGLTEGYWTPLIEWDEEGKLVDLIKLKDVSILLASLELESNKYTQLRLFLKSDDKDAWLILNDEDLTEVPLVIPSVYQTGIKLIHPFEIVEGMITKLTIDFDAEKSVIKTGNGGYKLKPVIKVTSETYSVGDLHEYTGSISGSVVDLEDGLPISGTTVSVSLSDGEYIFTTSIVTEQDGSFFIDQLPVGTYTLTVSAEGYIDHTEDGIAVTEGAATSDIDIVLTPVLSP